MKYSIIIPVYNAEKYIKRCIESILNQEYMDLEIIAINDGSLDSSLEILKSFHDSRLKILSIENQGVSNARNMGLSYAKGKYVIFLDADDYLSPDCFEVLDNIISTEYSIYAFCYQVTGVEEIEVKRIQKYNVLKLSKETVIDYLVHPNQKKISNSRFNTVWAKVFERNILKQNDICFNNKLNVGEDSLFFLEAVLHSETVIFVNYCMYYYFTNNNSITHTYKENMYENECEWQKCFNDLIGTMNLKNKQELIEFCLFKGLLNNIYLNILYRNQTWSNKRKAINKLLNSKLYKDKKIDNKVIKKFDFKDRVIIKLIFLRMYTAIIFLYDVKSFIDKKLKSKR